MRFQPILLALAVTAVPLLAAAPAAAGSPVQELTHSVVSAARQAAGAVQPSASGGVTCTGIAPYTTRCEAPIPTAAGAGTFTLDLGQMVEKPAAVVSLLDASSQPLWTCVATPDATDGCDGAFDAPEGARILVTLEGSAVGKWGWRWAL